MRPQWGGPISGEPPDPPDFPPPPKGTTGGGSTSPSDDVVPATVADTGSVLPIVYGTMRVPALLIEKFGPLQKQPDPWLPGTSYAIDAVVSNSGHAYKCTLAGSSAPANGPSTTGAGIVDGTNKWNFLAACREWIPNLAYALNAYCTNGGFLWKATTAGTSGYSGGPVGIDSVGNAVPVGTTRLDGTTLIWTLQDFCAPWSAGTNYYVNYYGHVSYCTNVGNAYQCVATGMSNGYSGSAGGPTGQQSTPIIENPGTTASPKWTWIQALPYYINAQEFVAALAEGQCTGITNVWWDKERVTYPAKGLVFAGGPDALGQTLPAPFDQAGYQHTALIYTLSTSTGQQEAAPAIAVELNGIQFGGGTADVNPADILIDIWTNTRRGCGLPSGRLDVSVTGAAASSFRVFCDAAGLRLSMFIDSQRSALAILAQLLLATGCDAVWSGGALKVIPLCDQSITAPVYGATNFVPNSAADYTLGPDDFLDAFQPVQVTRRPDADVFNAWPVEYTDRAGGYIKITVEDVDMVDFDSRGEVKRSSTTSLAGIAFPDGTRAVALARNLAQRSLTIRNTYRFRLPWTKVLVEPGSLLLLNDTATGLVNKAVRVTDFEEDVEAAAIVVTAEDYPAGATASAGYQPQQGDGLRPNDTSFAARNITTPSGTTTGLGVGVVGSVNIAGGAIGAGQLGIGQVGRGTLPVCTTTNNWPNPTSETLPPPGSDTGLAVWSSDFKTLLSGSVDYGARCFAAPAWIASHAYTAGQAVTNGGNGYVCTTGGTSAGAGGPTGSGASIVDNTVIWTWASSVVDSTLAADRGFWIRKFTYTVGTAGGQYLRHAFPVAAGESWRLSARAAYFSALSQATVGLNFYDSYGNQIIPSTQYGSAPAASGTYQDQSNYAIVPPGAVTCVAFIGVGSGSVGTWTALFDSISLTSAPIALVSDTPVGTVNGVNAYFILNYWVFPNSSINVYVGGVLHDPSTYTLSVVAGSYMQVTFAA